MGCWKFEDNEFLIFTWHSPALRPLLLTVPLDTDANFYTYDVTPQLRLICLDFYEDSVHGYPSTHPTYQSSLALLRAHNRNADLNSVEGMRGHALRFSAFNAALSARQLAWLRAQLEACRAHGRRALVCGHLPVHAQATDVRCLAWNAKDVLDVLWAYEGTCVAYLAGHDHDGGYFRDKKNIHHVTLAAVIETPPTSNAFATVNVYGNRIGVEGVGVIGYYRDRVRLTVDGGNGVFCLFFRFSFLYL